MQVEFVATQNDLNVQHVPQAAEVLVTHAEQAANILVIAELDTSFGHTTFSWG